MKKVNTYEKIPTVYFDCWSFGFAYECASSWYRPSEYAQVIFPFSVTHFLDRLSPLRYRCFEWVFASDSFFSNNSTFFFSFQLFFLFILSSLPMQFLSLQFSFILSISSNFFVDFYLTLYLFFSILSIHRITLLCFVLFIEPLICSVLLLRRLQPFNWNTRERLYEWFCC